MEEKEEKEDWNDGIMKRMRRGIMEEWKNGIMGDWKNKVSGSMLQVNPND